MSKQYNSPQTRALIRAVKAGNQEACQRLWTENHGLISRIVQRIVRNDTTEDLVQDIFIRIFSKIHTFKNKSKLTSWMSRIAINCALMSLRRTKRELSFTVGEDVFMVDGESLFDRPMRDLNICGTLDRMQLETAINKLPGSFRVPFVLHHVEGYSMLEISEMLGLKVPAVKSRSQRACVQLQQWLIR